MLEHLETEVVELLVKASAAGSVISQELLNMWATDILALCAGKDKAHKDAEEAAKKSQLKAQKQLERQEKRRKATKQKRSK